MTETVGADARGRALPRDLPSNAPTSPRVHTWYRRIAAWGFAPLFITGLVAGLLPGGASSVAAVGSLAMVCLTGVLTFEAFRHRRANQRRYETVAAEALERNKIVRVLTTAKGDFEYILDDPPVVEPLDWRGSE